MKRPEGEFSHDQQGKLNDPQEMLWLIHEMSVILYDVATDPRVVMAVGMDTVPLQMMATIFHAVTCDEAGKTVERRDPTPEGGLGKVDLPGLNLEELFKNFN